MESLIIPNEFNSYDHFCGVVVNQIFENKNIEGVIDEIDCQSDLTRRIFVTMEDGREYIIRTWDIHDDDDNEDADSTAKKEEDVLDMPPPWSPKLFVNKDKFLDLCPNGEKTVFYKKCKVDFYSECS